MAAKTRYSVSNLSISLLSGIENLSSFTCKNASLDNFFQHEVSLCQKYKYLSAYIVRDIKLDKIVALFTLANDSVVLNYEDDKMDFFETTSLLIDEEYQDVFGKQGSYPAINIGHLAVESKFQGMGIGTFVISFLIKTFLNYNISGCQFVTVDSLNNQETNKFYLRNGFYNQTNLDMTCSTRRMFLPLLAYK